MRGFFKRLFGLVWILMAISLPISIYGGTTPRQAMSALFIIALVVWPLQWVLSGEWNPAALFKDKAAPTDAA